MKAAILVENKKPLKIADIELPHDLKYGQVLVKVYFSGICGAQINEIDGVKGEDKFLPHLLGHEGGGMVEKCGPGVKFVKKGDHVVMHWMKGDGIQSPTPKYRWGNKTVNAGWVTTFNEYAIVSENRVTPIPSDYNLKNATLYGCALTTAFGVIENNAHLRAGESIVIFGSGGVGSAIIMAAKAIGANPIVAVDINDYKLKKSRKYGATHTINSKLHSSAGRRIGTSNMQDFNLKKICPLGFDVAVDTTGIKEIRELSYEITHATGRTILVGVPPKGQKIAIESFLLHFGKYITGSHGGDTKPEIDIPRLLNLEKQLIFKSNDLITHEFDLEHINDAIAMVRAGNAIRVIVKMF